MDKIKYKKLARAMPVVTEASLWLGPDYLLFIKFNGFSESYKRFYFRDIQALTVCRTNTARNINIVLGVIVFLFAFFGLVVASDINAKHSLLVIGAIFGVFLAINAIRGTSCRCYLKTAVQTEELSALSRLRRARKVLARIRPLITAAQSDIILSQTPPDLPVQGTETAPLAGIPVTPAASEPASAPPRLEA